MLEIKELEKTAPGKITTGVPGLDELLGGGLRTREITEFYSSHQYLVSSICSALCGTVHLPLEKGGLGKNTLYIDTKNVFRPENVVVGAKKIGLDPDKVLNNIFVGKAYNCDHQIHLIKHAATDLIKQKNIGLVVVDPLTTHFRLECGDGRRGLRKRRLIEHLHDLELLALQHDLAIVVTNQKIGTESAGGMLVDAQASRKIQTWRWRGDTYFKLRSDSNISKIVRIKNTGK